MEYNAPQLKARTPKRKEKIMSKGKVKLALDFDKVKKLPDFLVQTDTAAAALSLSQKTLREWSTPGAKGPISPVRMGGAVRWRWSDIMKVMMLGDAARYANSSPSAQERSDYNNDKLPEEKRKRGRPSNEERAAREQAEKFMGGGNV